MPLLQIMEIREPSDAGGMEDAVWCQVKCVGRALLDTEPVHADVDAGCFLHAQATCAIDDSDAEEDLIPMGPLLQDVRAGLSACREAERRLEQQGPPPRPLDSLGDLLSYGCASHHKRPALEATLDEVIAARRDVLQQRGLDEAPATSLRGLHEVWNVQCELEAHLQLVSWASCAWLDGEERIDAGRSSSPFDRLDIAVAGLRRRERALQTQLALERVIRP